MKTFCQFIDKLSLQCTYEFFHNQKEKVKKAFISLSDSLGMSNVLLESKDSSDDEEYSFGEDVWKSVTIYLGFFYH